MFGSTLGNILGTLYFLYFQLAGILLMGRLLKKEGPLTRLLLGSVAGSLLLQWLPIVFAFFVDFTILGHILALLAALPAYLYAFGERDSVIRLFAECPLQIRCHSCFFLLLAGTMVLWVSLLHTHTIPLDESGAMLAGQCTYGDMNIHLGFITSIANQGTFPPEYSLFPGARLSYPFLSDSISSSIYLMGASLRYAYILPMLVAFPQVIGGAYLLAMTLFRSRIKALLTYVLFFFNGGLGFLYFIDWAKEREFTLENIFTGWYTTPTNLIDHNIRWVNIIVDMLLPQRATLFGYAVLFSAIWLLHQAAFGNRKEYFPTAGIVIGSLPMIHTHSFLGMALISAAWLLIFLYRSMVPEKKRSLPVGWLLLAFVMVMCFLQDRVKKGQLQPRDLLILGVGGIAVCVIYGMYLLIGYLGKRGWRELLHTWGIYLGCVLVPALPQLFFWTFGQVSENSFVKGCFNWGNQGDFYPWFYLKNMGLPLVLIIAAVCAKRKTSSHLILPAFVIWFLLDLITFQPNVYDNNKLLYIAWLLLCLVAADYGAELYKHLKTFGGARWLAGSFLFFSTISAVLTMGREVVSEYQLYGASNVKLAQYIDENTPADAVFLTQTRHNNEVSSLAGRNIVCGADTFLYYHGFDTTQRKEDIRQMYEAPVSSLTLYEKYEVSYVVVTNWERSSYAIDEAALQELFELVFEADDARLYKVK